MAKDDVPKDDRPKKPKKRKGVSPNSEVLVSSCTVSTSVSSRTMR